MTINILYDISTLGISHRDQKKSGISRTTEALLRALLDKTDLSIMASSDVSFTAWFYSRLYLETSDIGNRLSWVSTSLNAQARDKITQLFLKKEKFSKFIQFLKDKKIVENPQTIYNLYNLRNQFINYKFSGTPAYRLSKINIYHSSYYSVPEVIRSNKKVKLILTVHDLIPILHPEWCGMLGNEIKYFHPEFNLPQILQTINQDTWIVCPSQATKNDLCEYVGNNLDPAKVYVTPWAASDSFYPCHDLEKIASVKQKYNIPGVPYLLCLSTIEPRKNVDGVIRAFREAIKQEKIYDLAIVIAGELGWQYEPILREAKRFPRLAPRIIFTGHVDEADLAALYSGALMFVYPSFYEGFGLPPLEAMQCGTPVITSNNTSLPEVVGDAVLLVNPRDEAEISQSILKIYQSSQLRSELSQKSLRRSQEFSWDLCADKTVSVYNQALNS